MKRWIRKNDTQLIEAAEEQEEKLKRTPESGHSYDKPIVFNNIDEYLEWCKEDEKYED